MALQMCRGSSEGEDYSRATRSTFVMTPFRAENKAGGPQQLIFAMSADAQKWMKQR